jgi:hypothetical protein
MLLLLLLLLLLAQVCCAALELMRPIGSGVKLPGALTVASVPAAAAAAAVAPSLLLPPLVPLPLNQLLRPLLAPPALFLRFRGEASGPKISPQPLFPSKAPRGGGRNGASLDADIVCRATQLVRLVTPKFPSLSRGEGHGDTQRTICHVCRWQERLVAALLRRLGESFGRKRRNRSASLLWQAL